MFYTYGDAKHQSIVFIHGFPYDNTLWSAQIEAFSNDYYCIAYDLRGLGESLSYGGQHSMETFVDDLENLISHLNLKKPIICAMSMGGYIALRALERFEEKFSGLILCDTVASSDTDEGKLKRASAIKTIDTKGLESFVGDFVPKCFGDLYKSKNKKEVDAYIEKSSKLDPVGVKGAILAMTTRTDTTNAVEESKIPLLFMCGEDDVVTPPEAMRTLARKSKKSKFILISNAGHMSMVENPTEVNVAIKDFIECI